MKRNSQQGVALVTTLIMLSLVTVLSIAFLAVSRRERASVDVSVGQLETQFAGDAAQASAIANVMALISSQTNKYLYELIVSTNFDGANQYTYMPLATLATLQYDARAPVYVTLNSGVVDFPFYLDFNQNRMFDTNNLPTERVGDPEWIGILQYPDKPHSGTNRFVGRRSFLVMPAGKSLDLNFIHNQAKATAPSTIQSAGKEGFLRNMGVGPWEINLAGLLNNLNSNAWPSVLGGYDFTSTGSSTGTNFVDANRLLQFRYDNNFNTLPNLVGTFGATYGPLAVTEFQTDYIDQYSNFPLMTGTGFVGLENDGGGFPWSGSDSTNVFYDVRELLNVNNPYYGSSFTTQLRNISANNNDYDSHTFYRLLAQLGTESVPPAPGKMHLNYRNVTEGTVPATYYHQTNFVAWTPIGFFTNAVERLLVAHGYGFGVTNITIYSPTNGNQRYTSDIHRILQLAANLYDATQPFTNYPSVFRPQFANAGNNVIIRGYVEEVGTNFVLNAWRDLQIPSDRTALATNPDDNVYGIPLVIGAKKGWPSFNEFTLQTSVQVSRKVEVVKATTNSPPIFTNQMYIVGISNVFGAEGWNSYTSSLHTNLEMRVVNRTVTSLTDVNGTIIWPSTGVPSTFNSPAIAAGYANFNWNTNAFLVPLIYQQPFLPNSQYYVSAPPYFRPLTAGNSFEQNVGFAVPTWTLNITNYLRYALIDRTSGRVIDFVNLTDIGTQLDISQELIGNQNLGEPAVVANQWDVNRPGGSGSIAVPTLGVINQIQVSAGNVQVSQTVWDSFDSQAGSGQDKNKSIDAFRNFLGQTPIYGYQNFTPTNRMQAPFSPTRKIYQEKRWEANDPFVHYTPTDLMDQRLTNNVQFVVPPSKRAPFPPGSIGKLNDRYRPWGGNPSRDASGDTNAFRLEFKDPLIWGSDSWVFPDRKFANVGWLGRVHRGTPWQTVYLKAEAPSDEAPTYEWSNWSGNAATNPTNDWRLVDMFTVAVHDNATRSLLSVNQANVAAWAAVLSGMLVITNTTDYTAVTIDTPPTYLDLAIEPDSWQLAEIVNAINNTRASLINQQPPGVFTNLATLLSIPALTIGAQGTTNSPYLIFNSVEQQRYSASDAVIERIPQQLMSLLTVEDNPRIVVYAFGQALKPAPRSIVVSGPYRGMCTNYQISGEILTRTVVRIEGAPVAPRAVVESYTVLPQN